MMEVVRTSETSVYSETTLRYIPEDSKSSVLLNRRKVPKCCKKKPEVHHCHQNTVGRNYPEPVHTTITLRSTVIIFSFLDEHVGLKWSLGDEQ
jgi:hypothetical protein